jgi:putative ABC transport system ATP-binding protein
MNSPVVSVRGVNLHLKSGERSLHILRDITFELQAGEVVSVVGPSGSGKTSLLMLLAGLERASSGDIGVAGTALGKLNEDQLADMRRRSVGILFQNFHLIASMTALENVSLAIEIADDLLPLAEMRRRAREALAEVGLADRVDHLPSALSGGEQQRVGLARALVTRPVLLLADEPTGNLDQETGEAAADLLFALARTHGTTVMLITHDAALARRADRLLTMKQGVLHELETTLR